MDVSYSKIVPGTNLRPERGSSPSILIFPLAFSNFISPNYTDLVWQRQEHVCFPVFRDRSSYKFDQTLETGVEIRMPAGSGESSSQSLGIRRLMVSPGFHASLCLLSPANKNPLLPRGPRKCRLETLGAFRAGEQRKGQRALDTRARAHRSGNFPRYGTN